VPSVATERRREGGLSVRLTVWTFTAPFPADQPSKAMERSPHHDPASESMSIMMPA